MQHCIALAGPVVVSAAWRVVAACTASMPWGAPDWVLLHTGPLAGVTRWRLTRDTSRRLPISGLQVRRRCVPGQWDCQWYTQCGSGHSIESPKELIKVFVQDTMSSAELCSGSVDHRGADSVRAGDGDHHHQVVRRYVREKALKCSPCVEVVD